MYYKTAYNDVQLKFERCFGAVVKGPTDSTSSELPNGQSSTTKGHTGTTNGQTSATSGQTNEQTSNTS